MTGSSTKVEKRDIRFAERTVTRIWQEIPTPDNPYLAAECRCHGYDILELARKRSFVDVIFLLFQGELPTPEQAKLLEILAISLINPGPRHPASRAAMNAGVGKTNPAHILPIGLSVLSGEHLGGQEVSASIRFLRKKNGASVNELVEELLNQERPQEGDFHIAPGFGSRFGGIDPMPQKTIDLLLSNRASGKSLSWGNEFAATLHPHGMGWLAPGVAAAVFCDLGFLPQAGAGLFQLISAPGILAQGLEMSNKPISAMPFLDEEHYVIEQEARKQ